MAELTREWRRWIGENVVGGRAPDDIVAELVARGIRADEAWAVVARALADTLHRRDSLLGVQQTLAALVLPPEIPRRATIDRADFLREHYALQRPLVVTGPFAMPWTFASLAERHGELDVEIQDRRERARETGDYQRDFERFCRRAPLGELLARIAAEPTSNDYYLTAKNRLLEQPGAAVMLADFPPLPDFLEPPRAETAGVWIGPAGTHTPLHHDWANVAILQICGRKRFHLVAAWQAPHLCNRESRFSDLDCEQPLPDGVRAFEVELAPGELLFIPVGWFHQARALEPSISASLTGFAFPNRYDWNCDTSR